jgi:hypothetical protein
VPEVSDGWSWIQVAMLFGVVAAVVAAIVSYKKSGRDTTGYEKTMS